MNEDDFRSAAADMEDTALWDVRRIALLAGHRDEATPVRYFEDAVTESLRSLHRLSQESLWDELQKHELGKRTLRSLAAEYKPARMVTFELDDLRRASVRFWELLRAEDEGVREALAAYDYEACCGLLAKLSGTLQRDLVTRLVYINCPRQNVLEEVVGTIQRCTTNELKMLASKLYDRLDKTGTLTPEKREFAKKLPHCKTKEELRQAVRDLLQMFKRKPPPGEADPSAHLIGPSVATVTVSYKGQTRQVAALVRIERLDKVPPEEPKVEPPPPPTPPPAPEPEPEPAPPSPAHSVVTVNSDRTIPPSYSPDKHDTEQDVGGFGSEPLPSGPHSKAPSVRGAPSAKPSPPASVSGLGRPIPSPKPSPKPSPPMSVVGVDHPPAPGSDIPSAKPAPSLRSTSPGSVLGGARVSGAAASGLGSVRGSQTLRQPSPSPPMSVYGGAAASAGPGSAVNSVRPPPSSSQSPKATPPGSVLGGAKGPDSDVGSARSGTSKTATPKGSLYGGGGDPPAPGSVAGSTRSGLTHKTTPAGSTLGAAAAGAGSNRSARTTPAGSVVGGLASAGPGSEAGSMRSGTTHKTMPAGSVYDGMGASAPGSMPASAPSSAVGKSSGPASVKSMGSRSSSQGSIPGSAQGEPRESGGASSHRGFGSISFDHPNLPPPSPKPLSSAQLEAVEAGSDRSGFERTSAARSTSSYKSPDLTSRTPSVASSRLK